MTHPAAVPTAALTSCQVDVKSWQQHLQQETCNLSKEIYIYIYIYILVMLLMMEVDQQRFVITLLPHKGHFLFFPPKFVFLC